MDFITTMFKKMKQDNKNNSQWKECRLEEQVQLTGVEFESNKKKRKFGNQHLQVMYLSSNVDSGME